MNIFRLCGDMSHLLSIIVLLLRLRVAKNAQGKSSVVVVAVRCGATVERLSVIGISQF
jgi:hypothetical protein